jgi:transcriptional regulator with XRE-family HTH domain
MNEHPLKIFRERHTPPLTQQQLAQLLGVSKATISRYESGKRAPLRKDLPRLSAITGITPAALIGLADMAAR